MIINIGSDFYRIKDKDIYFKAIFINDKWKEYFFNLKRKSLKNNKFIEDININKIVDYLTYYVIKHKINIITTPPSSGQGINWAAMVAKKISTKSGIDYVTVFGNHKRGRRFGISNKLKSIDYKMKIKLEKERILLFDDFSYTRKTMANAVRVLEKDNDVMGIVIYSG